MLSTVITVVALVGTIVALAGAVWSWTQHRRISMSGSTSQETVIARELDMLDAQARLAWAYRSVGRLPESIELFERNLADSERILGPDHPDTLRSRNNLAGAYEEAGRLDKAIALYERNLADSERILGPEHPDTLRSRNNLAGAYD